MERRPALLAHKTVELGNRDRAELSALFNSVELDEKVRQNTYPETFEFLNAAIAEDAHLRVPARLVHYNDAPERWLVKCHIAREYYFTNAVEEDIGRQHNYGISGKSENPNRRSGPRKQVKTFIEMLRENCSPQTQARFPLGLIPLDKPLPQGSRDRKRSATSLAQGGIALKVAPMLTEGKDTSEIYSHLGADYSYRSVAAAAGKERKRLRMFSAWQRRRALNIFLTRVFESLPDSTAAEQRFLDRIDFNFVVSRRDLFLFSSDLVKLAGLGKKGNHRAHLVYEILRDASIPVREFFCERVVKCKIYRNHVVVVLPRSKNKAVNSLKNHFN